MGDGDENKYAITVTARSRHVPELSDAAAGRYVFAYTVRIVNSGRVPARLVARHWIITDALNQVQEVRGLGVVGEQPLLAPRQSYEYTSSAAIHTPAGTMRGSYQMIAEDGVTFDAVIPEFALSAPRVLH